MRVEEEKKRSWLGDPLGDPFGERVLTLWLQALLCLQTFVHSPRHNWGQMQELQHGKQYPAVIRMFRD